MQHRLLNRGFMLVSGAGLLLAACTGNKDDKASLPSATKSAESPVAEVQGLTPASAVAQADKPAGETPLTMMPETQPPQELAMAESGAAMRLTGAVSSLRRSSISFHATGFVQNVLVKPGKFAKKGEVLAELDARDFKLRLELARARRDLAKVGLENARKEYQREQQLQKDNASTEASYDKLMTAFEQAKLSLRLAEIEVTTAEEALTDTRLVAPYDCVVATQLKFEGENVQIGNVVFEVYDTAPPEISMSAPERLMGRLNLGDTLAVAVPSAGFKGEAEIIRFVPVISDKTRTFQVVLKLKDASVKVVAGSYAEAVLN